MTIDYEKEFADTFDEMGDIARATALLYFRKNLIVDEKNDKTPVTQADREIEQKLRDYIKKKFPSHGVIGEEFGKDNAGAEFVWVIDPIDGTKAFATGRPTFGTIIGLAHSGKPVAGIVDQAFTKERWFGVTDTLCRHNGVPTKVAAPRPLSAARFHTTTSAMFEGGYIDNFEVLQKAVKWPIFSCDCYAYGLLALGWIDLVVERQLKVHDVMGIVPIVTGAGGFASDWNGKPIGLEIDGTFIAASTRELAMDALQIVMRGKTAA